MTAAYSSPATARNQGPILEVLRTRIEPDARVLEIASGAGEHAVHMARALPGVTWRPTDRDDAALASIAAWRAEAALPNILEPLLLDAAKPETWPDEPADAIVCINMIHIAPWEATQGLMKGAGAKLKPGGRLFLYGPYREDGRFEAASNAAFDLDLKRRNPLWGVRDREAVTALAAEQGLVLEERIEMPANNLILVFRRA
jgi:cyclopropane fatty-acyl-phospholipid synthase-like methyltransferase